MKKMRLIRGRDPLSLGVLFPIVLLVVFLVFPVAYVILVGILPDPIGILTGTVQSAVTQKIIIFTVVQALLSTLLAVLLGLPGAFLVTRLDFRGKSVIRALILVPFVLPPIVVVVGFLTMFGNGGILDHVAMVLFGSSQSVVDLASGPIGIILAHTFYNIPLIILLVSASLVRLNPEIEESAEILGVSTIKKFRHIILPHIKRSLLASSILVFLFCFMSFPIVLALGESRIMTMEVEIYHAFRQLDFATASALALLQLMVTLLLAYIYLRLGSSEDEYSGRTAEIKTISFRQMPWHYRIASLCYIVLIAILVTGPFIAIIQSAIYDPFAGEFTLRGFTNLLRSGVGGGFLPLVNSLLYASLATGLTLILALPLAYSHRSRRYGLSSVSSLMTLLPLGVSSITVAYGLMIAITVPLGLTTYPWPIIVIAQTIIGLPFAVRAIEVSLQNIDPEVLEQATALGASRLQRLFFVELPLLAPGLLVGAVFAFAMAIGEMSATLFIALPQNITLSIAIYQYLGVRKFVEAGASALVIALVCFVAFLILEKYSDVAAGGGP